MSKIELRIESYCVDIVPIDYWDFDKTRVDK